MRAQSLFLLILLIGTLAPSMPARAQQPEMRSPTTGSSPGRYRSQGQYRSQGRYLGSKSSTGYSNYSQHNKYFKATPGVIPFSLPPSGKVERLGPRHGKGHSHYFGRPHAGFLSYPVYVPYAVEPEPPPPPPPAPAPQIYVVQPPPPPPPPPVVEERPEPTRRAPSPVRTSSQPGELTLAIHPSDARVHINDRFVGTGNSLALRSEPLILKAGVYVLETDHPNHEPQRLIFGVNPEKTVHVVVDLTADKPGRRARVQNGSEADFILN